MFSFTRNGEHHPVVRRIKVHRLFKREYGLVEYEMDPFCVLKMFSAFAVVFSLSSSTHGPVALTIFGVNFVFLA